MEYFWIILDQGYLSAVMLRACGEFSGSGYDVVSNSQSYSMGWRHGYPRWRLGQPGFAK